MKDAQFNLARKALMDIHNEDPVQVVRNGQSIGDEGVYALRMVDRLYEFYPMATQELELAALAHHIKRWEIKRTVFAMDKQGYFQWRRQVAKHQLAITSDALAKVGLSDEDRDEVLKVLRKENLKTHPLAQVIEDVACLVFIQYYLEPFAEPHETPKVVEILRKTMLKMSDRAIEEASRLPVSDKVKSFLNEAVKLLPE